MFCHKCGNQSLTGAEFCQKCGAKLIGSNTAPQTLTAPGATVIPNTAGDVKAPDETVRYIDRDKPTFDKIVASVGKHIWKWAVSAASFILIAFVVISVLNSNGGLNGIFDDKYVKMVKGGTMENYPQATVGDAFDKFLSNAKWESGAANDGKRYVNVRGGAVYMEKEVEVAVQFLVEYDEGRYKIHAFEINDVPQNLLMLWGLLEAAYRGVEESTPTPSTVPEALTADDAWKIAVAWLDAHPAMLAEISGGSNDLYQANGEEYYMFYLGEMYWLDILVHSKTGELLCRQSSDGEEPGEYIYEPLNDYYNKYYGD